MLTEREYLSLIRLSGCKGRIGRGKTMVILKEQPLTMPRPFGGGIAPVITVGPKPDGSEGRYIDVQITGVISNIYQFLEVIQVLDGASEKDVIDIRIDTPGGCVFTTQALLERMNSCKATVTTVASGLVASAGTFLWFFSKNRRVEDLATFMFHSSSHCDAGKSLAIHETSEKMVEYMHKTVKAMIAAGILTSDEASRIFRQKKDLFLPGSIIRARMMAEMASTEGLALRNEGDGQNPDPDFDKDPVGKPDEHSDDTIDGGETDGGGSEKPVDGEPIKLDPAAIFRAEGVEPGTDGDGDGDGDGEGDDNPAGEPGDTEGKCGKKKKVVKKGKKRVRAADGDGDTGDDTSDGGSADGDGSEEDPVDPEKAESPDAFLKW